MRLKSSPGGNAPAATISSSAARTSRRRKTRHRPAEPAHLLDGLDAALSEPSAGFGDEIAHHAVDQPANRLMDQACFIEPGIASADLREHRAHERHLGEIGYGEEAGAQPI